jgi:hypothetical protein
MEKPNRRQTDRILAPVRIRVIGNDTGGVSFAEETVTVSFNQNGARISLTHSLLSDDIVLVKNLENGIEEEFRVVGALQQVFGDRREWGVEALNSESAIWGVSFAALPEAVAPKVLVECAACKTAGQSTLSSIEYDVLLATGLISRHCERCGETTRWKPSDQVVAPEIPGHARKPPAQVEVERRRHRRLKLLMQLRVRNTWGIDDVAQTRDVSKAGLCFFSAQGFAVGDEVHITLPYAKNQAPVETKGRIVWAAGTTSGRFFGVEYVA